MAAKMIVITAAAAKKGQKLFGDSGCSIYITTALVKTRVDESRLARSFLAIVRKS